MLCCMSQLLDSQLCHKWSSNVFQYAVDKNSVSGNFLTETWSQRVSFDLEAAGPKPVLVCVRLLLCESHWKKVLSGKDPTDKACNTAGSNNGVDISRWGAGVKISRILKSRIHFTFTGNLAHDYLSSSVKRRNV